MLRPRVQHVPRDGRCSAEVQCAPTLLEGVLDDERQVPKIHLFQCKHTKRLDMELEPGELLRRCNPVLNHPHSGDGVVRRVDLADWKLGRVVLEPVFPVPAGGWVKSLAGYQARVCEADQATL